jgi:ferredoxin
MITLPIIRLKSSGKQITARQPANTLLEVFEQNQLPVEYQCRSGYCGACRMKLLKGQVSYQQTPLACMQKGEILPCCCRAVSDIDLEY